jgi:hypothetical protein
MTCIRSACTKTILLSYCLSFYFASSLAQISKQSPKELEPVQHNATNKSGSFRGHSTICTGLKNDFDEALRTSKDRIREIIEAIHQQQHPPRSTCKHRRLLVLQFSITMEGIGSLLKLMTAGLAEAAHSNRTLVWGLDLPYSFSKTRQLWQSQEALRISGIDLFCEDGWRHQGGGPYSCFFQPLSSCSLEDAEFGELEQLGVRGFSDESRLKIMEARRGPACFHPPVNIPLYHSLFDNKKRSSIECCGGNCCMERHEWAAALAAYVFRLKPGLRKIFDDRKSAVWPSEAGGKAFCQCGNLSSTNITIRSTNSGEVWGLHIRHGDNKAMPRLYGNKRWYPLAEYLRAARERVHDLGTASCSQTHRDAHSSINSTGAGQCVATPSKSLSPSAIFITSDTLWEPRALMSSYGGLMGTCLPSVSQI